MPIVTTPRHPSAVAAHHVIAPWTRPFENESPRPLDPRVGREDQPRQAQRHVDPTIAGLADLERELDAAGVGVVPHPWADLSDEAFDDQAGRSRHPGQPLALSEELEKVAVLESGHRHEPAAVVGEVEDFGGLFDGARFLAAVGAGHRSIASRLAARRVRDGRAAAGAQTPGRLGGGRIGLPCRWLSLWPCQSARSQPDRQRPNDDPDPDRLADPRAGVGGRGGRSLPLWHLHSRGCLDAALSEHSSVGCGPGLPFDTSFPGPAAQQSRLQATPSAEAIRPSRHAPPARPAPAASRFTKAPGRHSKPRGKDALKLVEEPGA